MQKTQQQLLSLLQSSSASLDAQVLPSAAAVVATPAVEPIGAVAKASTVVRSETEAVEYGEVPLSGARLERLRVLVDALRAQAFKGTLRVEIFTAISVYRQRPTTAITWQR